MTSRNRHNLTRERILPLEGLSVQEGRDLFIEVAGDKLPKNIPFEMKEAIEELSKKTGGHPLSIEILASTYTEILLPELREMFEHLGAGIVNPEELEGSRHKSLEASFEYSISKLPDTHKLLLPKLAVMFKSPFPALAVEFIFGNDDESARTDTIIIRELYNSSLLRRIDFDDYGDIEGKYRLYHFHPSVRNYLERKVQEVEANKKEQELEERYGEQFSLCYNKLLEETYNAIGTKDHVLSLERFNVIFSQGKDNDFERAIRLAKDRSVGSGVSTDLGIILEVLGMYSQALKFHNKALSIHHELKDRVRMAGDYNNIGNALRKQGNYTQALEYLKNGLAISEELKDKVGMATAYANIGVVLRYQGNYTQALEYHNKALSIHHELKDRVRMAGDYNNIGNALRKQGNYTQALEYLKKGAGIHEELKDKVGMAIDYRNIGAVLRHQGDYTQALEFHNKALAIDEELKDKVGMAMDYANIGAVLDNQGNHNQALEYFNKPLAIHEELKDRVGMAMDYRNIGSVLANIKNRKAAINSFSKGLEILKEHEEKTGYHHPLDTEIRENISQLQDEKEIANNNDKKLF